MIIMEVINNNNSIISDNNEYNKSESNAMKDSDEPSNIVSGEVSMTNINDIPKEEVKNAGTLTLEQPLEDSKPKLPLLLVPSLKGKMSYEGGDVICKGVWGMSDEAHNQPGQTSEFEFKLLKKDDDSQMFPVDGLYQGWFMMKQPPPQKPLKVDEKELIFKFTSMENGAYSIDGKGVNKFGSFNLRGTLSEDGDVHVYREYFSINPPGSAKRRMSHTPRATPRAGSEKKKPGKDANSKQDQDQLVSPRESVGRVRKQSAAMQEYQDSVVMKSPRASIGSDSRGKQSGKEAKFAPLKRQDSGSSVGTERAQRLSYPIKKCLEVLKELSRIPQAQWFLEPVDHVKLNLPDYPNIVKKPMDFSTIRSKANSGDYETPDSFADDMRLVFRNAITFNTASENPVHIAAREMAVRFEDRYRVLTSQLDGNGIYSAASAAMLDEASGKGNKLRKSLSKGQLKGMSSSASSSNLSKKAKKSLGPRPPAPYNYHVLPTSDASAYQIAEMQRQISRMQKDIDELRLLVRQNQVVDRVTETREAAQNPLSLQEKQLLISQIHKLVDTELMGPVLEIIQSALPHEANIDEIPLDVLDTLTLRKLQQYVDEVLPLKKKRTSNGGSNAKRQRKNGSISSYSEPMPIDGSSAFEHGNFGDEELLFPNESFDHPSQSSNPPNSNSNLNQSTTSTGRPRAGSLDDEDFSALVGIKQHSPVNTMASTLPDPSATTAIPEWYKS